MSIRSLAVLLVTFLVSDTAAAWAVPVHLCSVPSTPTPVGTPIPCSYTNEDGQTFNGVVTRTGNDVLCVGLVAPTPTDPAEAASVAALYASLKEDPKGAPVCEVQAVKKGARLECSPGEDPVSWGVVRICGGDWCHELTAYADCADYYSTEPVIEGVTCDDLA